MSRKFQYTLPTKNLSPAQRKLESEQQKAAFAPKAFRAMQIGTWKRKMRLQAEKQAAEIAQMEI